MLPDFEEDFASLADYARLYRSLGLQAVPSYYPSRAIHNWKRPALKEWRDFQNELVDDATFASWFAHVDDKRNNIGILTGNCSGRVFVVDLDTHSKPDAALWWSCCLDMQERAADLESPTQRTGGGGLQILFRAPEGWNPPTIKTSIGVDIRGVGGFIVAAPSMHQSGQRYEWIEGKEPWNLEIAEAPQFLCEQIDLLAEKYGGHTPSDPTQKTASPEHATNAWGNIQDGREDYMFKMIWARLTDIARDCPFEPTVPTIYDKERDDLFQIYLSKVETRLPHGPGADKAELLDKEGRGYTEFKAKWKASMKGWDKVLEAAKVPNPNQRKDLSFADKIARGIAEPVAEKSENKPQQESEGEDWDKSSPVFSVVDPKPTNLFEVLRVDDIYNLPDPVFLIEKLMIESAMAFIYGVPGCGKTFVALDLAFSLCDPEITHWWGRKINKHGPVLYISSEGSTDMKFRMKAWEKKTGRKINRKNFHFIRESMNFVDPSHIVKLIQTIKHEIENYCHEKPIAIFVDTVSRVLPGADENLQKDMTLYVQGCDAVRHAFGCAVVGVHHMAKGGGTSMRGSSVFEGSANVALHIEREKPAMTGTMTARKIKEAADGWEIAFELVEVAVDLVNTSLVACRLDTATVVAPATKDASTGFGGKQETQKEPDMDMCRKMVQAIDDAWRGGYPWGRGKESDRNAAERLSDSFGFTVEVCQKYVNLWHRQDVIITDIWGEKGSKKGLRKGKGL